MVLSPAARERSLVVIILLGAFLLRLYCATAIEFESSDEVDAFNVANRISLYPDQLFSPLGSEQLFHPPLNQYLIKIGCIVGGMNPLAARLPFLMLAIISLLFLYLLAREGLGRRGAFFALLLAGFDQYLIHASLSLMGRVYLSFIPPALYFFYRGIKTGAKKHFILLGMVAGLGYLGKETVVLLLPGLGLFLLFNAHARDYLLRPHLYVAIVATMVIISPSLVWNLTHGAPAFEQLLLKFQQVGFSPRVIAIYLGELILASLSPAYVFMNIGHRLWSEAEVTPHWVTGALCLFASMWSIKEWKRDFFQLLLLIFCGEALVVSFMSSYEDLNNFWWASGSYLCVLMMAAHFLDDISTRGKGGLFLVVLFCGYVIVRGWIFVHSPDHCSRYLRQEMRELCRINQTNREGSYAEAEKLAMQFIKENPQNDMGHVFLGESLFYQKENDQAEKEYEQAYNLNPKNVMVPYYRARIFVAKNQLDQAVMEMFKALNLDLQNYTLHYHLAIIYNAMGNLDGAIGELERAIRLKSDRWENYGFLAALYFRKGKYAEARVWIDRFSKFYPNHQEALDMVRRLEVMGY